MNLFTKSCPERVYVLLDEYGFALYDDAQPPTQNALARGPSGKELAKWAFQNGAHFVRHDYDLGKEPNP